MNVGFEKAKAAGVSLSFAGGVAPIDGLPPAKQPSTVETRVPAKTVGAKTDAKSPNVTKQVEARKAVAPKLVKKRATVVKPVVTKTRCFAQRPVTKTRGLSTASPAVNPTLKFPVFAGGASTTPFVTATGLLSRLWRWIRSRQAARSSTRRLHVAATASLGEKRFVAVIQIDGLQFLVGGGATNVVLLARLDAKESFGDLLNEEKTDHTKQQAFEQTKAQA